MTTVDDATRDPRRDSRARLVGELVVVLASFALFALAWRADMHWFERHFSFDSASTRSAATRRAGLAVLGVLLLVAVRRRAGRWVERVGLGEAFGASVRMGIALSLSLVASEVGLRILGFPRRYDTGIAEARLGEKDARYGWLFKASQSFTVPTDGRPIRYDFDREHDRAASVSEAPDPARPTIFFVGESVTAGHGLNWEESYPALVGKTLGLQVVDLGVDGYGSDQAFLRLADTLPRFAHPVAVVTVFIPFMVDRLRACDHPHLTFDGDEPRIAPPGFVDSLRLTQFFREAFAYRSEEAIQSTAEILRQTARLSKEHGATALFAAPFLGTAATRPDGYLVDELLTRQGLTVIDPSFGYEPIPNDNHPNAASTRRLAGVVAAALEASLSLATNPDPRHPNTP